MFAKLKSAILPPALIVIGGIIAFGAYTDGKNFKAIADHGKTAEATVDSVSWKEKSSGRNEKGFKIDVHFETEKKEPVKATLSVSKSEGQRFRDDDNANTVQVKYLPESPSTVILAGATDESGFMMIVGGIMAVVGVGIFVFRRRKKAAEATVAA